MSGRGQTTQKQDERIILLYLGLHLLKSYHIWNWNTYTINYNAIMQTICTVKSHLQTGKNGIGLGFRWYSHIISRGREHSIKITKTKPKYFWVCDSLVDWRITWNESCNVCKGVNRRGPGGTCPPPQTFQSGMEDIISFPPPPSPLMGIKPLLKTWKSLVLLLYVLWVWKILTLNQRSRGHVLYCNSRNFGL